MCFLYILVVDVALVDRKVTGRNRSRPTEGWLLNAPSNKRSLSIPSTQNIASFSSNSSGWILRQIATLAHIEQELVASSAAHLECLKVLVFAGEDLWVQSFAGEMIKSTGAIRFPEPSSSILLGFA
jgi:hypothetical protein